MNVTLIITATGVALALISFMLPNLSRSTKIKLGLSALSVCCALIIFTSNHYSHWKYFDEKNVNIFCQQIPPIMTDDKHFYYRYIAILKNSYPKGIKITSFHMKFQTRMDINSHEVLLNDMPDNSLIIKAEGASVLSFRTGEFEGRQILALSIDCSFDRNGHLLANNAATVNIGYELFGTTHSKSIFVNPMSEMSLKMPQKEAVIFDLLTVIDHRMLPKSFFTYTYPHSFKFPEPSGRRLEIYCEGDKDRLLEIKYKNPHGSIIYESELSIHNDIDPIRVIVFANDYVEIHSWLGSFGKIRLREAARQFREGMKLGKQGEYEAASKAFKKVIELHANDFNAWFNYGLALEHLKDFESATFAFRKAIEVKGDYAKAHYELANVLIMSGNDEAIIHLKRAIEVDPKYALAYFRLGCLQKSRGDTEEASRNINKAIGYETRADRRDMYKKCLDELQASEFTDIPMP